MSSLTADVSRLTSGQTAVALPACASSCTINGVTYAYKSASMTAANPLAEGTLAYTVTAIDKANNTATTPGFSVTVDNTGAGRHASVIANTTTSAAGWIKKSGIYRSTRTRTDTASGVVQPHRQRQLHHQRPDRARTAGVRHQLHRRRRHLRLQERDQDGELDARRGHRRLHRQPDRRRRQHAQPRSGFSVRVDDTAPTGVTGAIANTLTGAGGYLRQGGTYNIYANAADAAAASTR